MGRKEFRNDVSQAISNPPGYIRNLKTLDDGEISFEYFLPSFNSNVHADLALLAMNVDEYPHNNEYIIFANEKEDRDIPRIIADSLELIPPIINHLPILDALKEIHNSLQQVMKSGQVTCDIESLAELDERDICGSEGDDMAEYWDDDDAFDDFGLKTSTDTPAKSSKKLSKHTLDSSALSKIRSDLRIAKDAGFRIGVHGDLSNMGVVCISIRVSKLGISDEVMQAWSLKPEQYLVLLVRFWNGFPTLNKIVLQERPSPNRSWKIQVGLCSSYKPNVDSAMQAFTDTGDNPSPNLESTNLQPLFIGISINDLFDRHFARVVKFRNLYSLGWSGAEDLVYDAQGAALDTEDMGKYARMCENLDHALPPIVLRDSLAEESLNLTKTSFPLTAMQFALRHVVRCTEFCLVCFRNLGSTFEALKPYVCSNPLCLYHHMKFGFGPSIEWEILTQPYVVDLLISFCYVQAQASTMKTFPIGINLKVPMLPSTSNQMPATTWPTQITPTSVTKPEETASTAKLESFKVSYNASSQVLLIDPPGQFDKHGLRKGDFVALIDGTQKNFTAIIYHQIRDVALPEVALNAPVITSGHYKEGFQPLPDKFVKVNCFAFNHNFDDLSNERKCKAIVRLLDALPPVQEMRQFLLTERTPSLRNWQARINNASLDVLRWVIASNRSCIMQVDNVLDRNQNEKDTDIGSSEDRLSGMAGYMQFRFAQGAPDKEKRFIDCVKQHTGAQAFPTMFAWHGSPVQNWHSIIREGLLFRNVAIGHGRAYGHGIYMSPCATTSMSYLGGQSYAGWPNSELKINSALSLNEVVNNPSAFVSRIPHYVVDKTDWVQTRYLLVKTNTPHTKTNPSGSTQFLRQDPLHTPKSIDGKNVEIPITAVSKSRRLIETRPLKRKTPPSAPSLEDIIIIIDDDDDNISVVTTAEDREWLVSEINIDETISTPVTGSSDIEMYVPDTDTNYERIPKKRPRYQDPSDQLELIAGCLLDKTETSFIPKSFDISQIERLPPPDDASRTASGALLKVFNTLIKTQRMTVAHDLGWYIDPDQIENMYQWIVELHSFDHSIPLANDMRQAGIKSIVLEMRFTNDYPFTPPFVRVIRPRFRPFAEGGGGHILVGGSICMELLTNSGWSAVSSIESVLLQIRLAMSERESPARLAPGGKGGFDKTYSVGEAISAYERACRAHGWTIPPAFKNLQR